MKTILYLRTDLTSQKIVAGGSVAHTLGVISGFLKEGKKVVCAASFMAEQMEELGPHEVKKLTIPRIFRSLPWRLRCIVLNVPYTFQIISLLRKYSIDCIYQRYSLFNFIGVILGFLTRIPFVLEYNGSEVWIDKNWSGSKPQWWKLLWIAKLIEKANLKYASSIIVVSQVLKEELVGRGIRSDKILVNPNGVDIDDFDPEKLSSDRERLRHTLGIHDKFVFGFVGSFSLWHGIEVIAAMIPEVIQKNPHTHFLLIGEGPLLSALKAELAKRLIGSEYVTCTGMIPQKEAKKYLAACDAYLSPTQPNKDGTRFFGSPTKLFEYMSMAKPIIASNLEQLTHIVYPAVKVEDEGNIQLDSKAVGVLVDPKNTHGFIAAAHFIATSDPEHRDFLGKNARTRAIQYYTWQQHAHAILSFIQR